MKLSVRSFTLIELLFTFSVLAFCLCGILLTYINMFILSDLARDLTLATNAAQATLEDVKMTNFDCIFTSSRPSPTCPGGCISCFYNGDTFDIGGITDAKGRVEIEATAYDDLRNVRIVSSFRSRNRIIGEDQNLNGALELIEDKNGNDRLDSVSELVTLISR